MYMYTSDGHNYHSTGGNCHSVHGLRVQHVTGAHQSRNLLSVALVLCRWTGCLEQSSSGVVKYGTFGLNGCLVHYIDHYYDL